MKYQRGSLDAVSDHARYVTFDLKDQDAAEAGLKKLSEIPIDNQLIVGLGFPAVKLVGSQLRDLKNYPSFSNSLVDVPSTQSALWLCVRGNDRGEISSRTRKLENVLSPEFARIELVDGFKYDIGRDLTGYEDGTENPQGSDAIEAAIVQDFDDEINSSSFVAVQKWRHDFSVFDKMSEETQDNIIGRHRVSNEEFDTSDSAHVKRTAQESFDLEAFLLRRSLP